MRVIALRTLGEHWHKPGRQDSEQPLRAWFRETEWADWKAPADIKAKYRSASFVGERVVFNIAGNKYRLVAWINYPYRVVYVRFVGTHAEYNKINVEAI
ncbi:MAG: type II toxin-antitoxin system HigB family toxin [Proteobacteria bacterium]|nr:type II toxin-antitoxin system HigB family toxin [Pseudomonadota bacterium]